MLPAGITEYFANVRSLQPEGAVLVRYPALVAVTRTRYEDKPSKTDHLRELTLMTEIEEGPAGVDWQHSKEIWLAPGDLTSETREETAEYGELPQNALNKSKYSDWQKQLVNWIYSERPLELYYSPSMKQHSQPKESERDFRIRLEQVAREGRDLRLEQFRKKYAPKVSSLQERIRRAEGAVEREKEQATQHKMQSTIAIGATLLGALFGRKLASATNVRGAGSAVRSMSRAGKEAGDIRRAEETLETLQQQLEELEAAFQADCAALDSIVDPRTELLETTALRPKKSNIDVRFCALTWLPYWRSQAGAMHPAWE
jgi:hypothetical protein